MAKCPSKNKSIKNLIYLTELLQRQGAKGWQIKENDMGGAVIIGGKHRQQAGKLLEAPRSLGGRFYRWVGGGGEWGILYFIVYITVPCIGDGWCIDGGGGGGGVFVMYTIEIQNLHLRAGASQRRDSASQRRDEIPPFTCIRNFIIPPTIPHRSSLENVPTFTRL